MPKLIGDLGFRKSVCPKSEYVIECEAFTFKTASTSIWKAISLSYCLTVPVVRPLFCDVDPRGQHISALKCESSCIDCLEHQRKCQSVRESNVYGVQTHLIEGLVFQAEISSSFVLLLPPWSFLKGEQTQAYLTQSLLCNVVIQEGRSPGIVSLKS